MKKFLIIVILLFAGSLLYAQTTQTIKGKITNPQTGEPIPDATVLLDGTSYGAVTDINGEYEIKNVPAGNYTLQVHAIGFQSTSTPLVVTAGSDITYNTPLAEETKHVKTVKVVGKIDKETDQSARKSEKDADNIKNVVSSQTIEKSPDITVANALQRVSGVSLQRTAQGDGRYAIIRGMDPRYNNTLVNGIKIPSPNMVDRYVPLDIMPADLLQRMEVVKGLTPDMEGDAIGGTVNLVMKDAPDSLYRKASLSTGYNQLFMQNKFTSYAPSSVQQDPYVAHGSNPDYTLQRSDFSMNIFNYANKHPNANVLASLALGKRFFKNKLGIMVGGSYQNLYRGSESKYYYTLINTNNQPNYTDFLNRFYSTHQIRQGYNLKMDYVFNKKHKISLYSVYFRTTDYEQRYTYDSILAVTGTNSSNYLLERSKTTIQSVYNATLQGKDSLTKNLFFDWSAVYSIATGKSPDWSQYEVDYTYNEPHPIGYLDATAVEMIWQKNVDRDVAGYANLSYTSKFLGINWEFKGGVLNRDKVRHNYYDDYILHVTSPTNGVVPPFTNIDDASLVVANPSGTSSYGTYNYTALENVFAQYGQVKAIFGKWNILGGLRNEITNQFYRIAPTDPKTPATKIINYNDPLASLHIKYALTEKSNLRASFFQGISRPNFFELVPYQQPGEQYTVSGNPYLKHTTSNNYDLRYELFPNAEDVFMVGTFYKFISNPIEQFFDPFGPAGDKYTGNAQALVSAFDNNSLKTTGSQPSDFYVTPFNFGNCTNYGLELMFIKYLGDFGLSGNYTYTNSNLQSPKIFYQYNASLGYTQISEQLQSRPLQGQAKGIGNLALLYRNKRAKINAQIAYNYTGKRIVQVSPYYGLDYWQQPLNLLDFSGDIAVTRNKKWIALVKINNLLNSPYVVKLTDGKLVQRDYYSRNFQVGVRYTF